MLVSCESGPLSWAAFFRVLKMKKIVIAMTFFSTLFGAQAQNTDQIKILNPHEFKQAITRHTVQLVDVRTAREFTAGHIANAVNIDLHQKQRFLERFAKMDKNKPIYLYCRSGARSQQAARMLVGMGFGKIYDLRGGYLRWN